jgi:hypothetical protein
MEMRSKPKENTPERRIDRQRAVSITAGFIINLGIATTLIALMFFLFQGLFTQVQDDTAGSEMRVVGEKVSSELQKADRLAQRGNGSITTRLPTFEQSYEMTITGEKDGQVILNSGSMRVSVNYSVDSDIADEYSTANGGRIEMNYEKVGDGRIELR